MRRYAWHLGCLAVLMLCGCAKEGPEYASDLVPVRGTVTLDGQPLADATVMFLAKQGESRQTFAMTDSSGQFALATGAGLEGALPGEYDVLITKFVMPDGSPAPPDVAPMDVGAVEALPPQYSSPSSMTLTATIPESGGDVAFDLLSKPARKR
ncbi:hypothetical protein Mal4_13080 [Maioricimonas rarisocia]|uniref:Carboxypeptidase regulatory-like domain-containing protein n=1 Tax=Maioricimonas rarisocia TaxID=2528026 RepID=A0A517Z3F8_9PLAN|nr:carboxypeptidase-like regulatory domain-containing protein [Maioricimonas rarisocia]QDU37005.1 hypothetical protein Mal4_13080 [Maioricimonas rarisocia]